jgi:hypothetical protein
MSDFCCIAPTIGGSARSGGLSVLQHQSAQADQGCGLAGLIFS